MKRSARICRALLIWLCSLASAASATEPARVPARDEVVETQLLPRAVKQPVQRLDSVKLDAAKPPEEPKQRIDIARRLIQAGRASGDPRTLGYAEAQLAGLPDTGSTGVEDVRIRNVESDLDERFAIQRQPAKYQI